MMNTARNRYPFTASQWQELEHQALIFKYMISGMPIPPHLLYTVKRRLDSSLSSNFLLHQPQQIEWSCYQMGLGRKIDPEPGRCRRTDGKKWRCSKEAYGDSKYCERHMHRGRNCSRKPVEISTKTAMSISSFYARTNSSPSSPTTISPRHHSLSGLKSLASDQLAHHQNSSSYGFHNLLSSQENTSSTNTNKILLESAAYSHTTSKGYSHGVEEGKQEVNEVPFLSETSGTMRSISSITMGSTLTNNNNLRQRSYCEFGGHSSLQLQSPDDNYSIREQKNDYFALDSDVQPKKVMHHFLEEWPLKVDKDCWLDDDTDKFLQNPALNLNT